jgi:hypothetical protein
MIMNSRVTKTRSKTSERCTPKSPYDATPDLIATNSIRKRRYIKLLKLEDERLRSNWGYAIRRALSSPPRRGLHAMDTALSIGLNELRKEVPQPTLISVPLHMRGGIELSTGLSVKRGLNIPFRRIDLVGVVFGVSDDDRPSPRVRARRRKMRRLKTTHGIDKSSILPFGKLTVRRREHPIPPIQRNLTNKIK